MDVQVPKLFETSSNIDPNTVLGSKYLNPEYLFNSGSGFLDFLLKVVTDQNTISTYKTIILGLSIFFLTIIIYSLIRVLEIRKKEHAYLHKEMHEFNIKKTEEDKKKAEGETISKNERWRQVLHLLFSTSENDWKLSIIEADAILEVLLGELGYVGDSLGEKLKLAGEKGFKSINNAWEVHNIRNRIAHEGSTFNISHHEAKRVIAVYEQIFRQFGHI